MDRTGVCVFMCVCVHEKETPLRVDLKATIYVRVYRTGVWVVCVCVCVCVCTCACVCAYAQERETPLKSSFASHWTGVSELSIELICHLDRSNDS